MVSFNLSAPGKIILFGEHSVVYGKTAIAASIGLRTYLKFQDSKDKNNITINFDAIDLKYEFPLQDVIDFIQNLNITFDNIDPQTIDHDTFLKSTTNFLEKRSIWKQFTSAQKSALTSFVYLLAGISIHTEYNIRSGFDIDLKSDLKVGAGLGSSASFSVILSGCFTKYMKSLQEDFDKSDLELISQWAFCSEKIMHGNPSGLDNCLCTFGSIVQYRKNEEMSLLKLDESATKFQAILVDTTVPRQTKTMVSNVRTLVDNHTEVGNKILEAMDDLAKSAVSAITSGDSDKCSKLKELIRINQGLLLTLGVSHPTINKICDIASRRNFASKLTGAGGGGYCIVIPFDTKGDTKTLIQEFERNGFPSVETTLGGPGLTVDDFSAE